MKNCMICMNNDNSAWCISVDGYIFKDGYKTQQEAINNSKNYKLNIVEIFDENDNPTI